MNWLRQIGECSVREGFAATRSATMMRTRSATALASLTVGATLVAILGAAAPVGAQGTVDQKIPTPQVAVSTLPTLVGASAEPGDVIRLRIWREPDMSGDYPVDAQGIATFPRLGSVRVTSFGADSLQRLLLTEYAKYLKNPSVEIVLLRRVRVVGAVKSPGVYTVDQTMRVRDVLALAGGASAEGRTDRARLDRDGTSTDIDLSSSPRADEPPLRSGDQVSVPQRGWFARNTALVAAVISVSGGLLFALVAR